MMDRIVGKNYLRIKFTLKSPLALGSGENDTTDKDLLKDSNGVPYIPASSVAGVVRECMQEGEEADEYFGKMSVETGRHTESRILFYDAYPEKIESLKISIRDSVSLDEYKTAKKGAKFDMEVLEAGTSFVTFIEQNRFEGDIDYNAKIMNTIFEKGLRFGGKTMRGYGETKIDGIDSITFDFFNNAEEMDSLDLKQWLDFDLYNDERWVQSKNIEPKNNKLCIELKQESGLSVRKYTTEPRKNEQQSVPDMETLRSNNENGEPVPVIPGTTWAGAFRSRMHEFGINTDEGGVFGYVKGDGKNEKSRSKLRFGESYLKDGYDKQFSRNSIDRFSGGTVEGALFTERTYYGGETTLEIEWCGKENEKMPDKERKALAAAITDLHLGFLAIGGETSIGRGLFKIEKINNNELKTPEDASGVYDQILNAIGEVM